MGFPYQLFLPPFASFLSSFADRQAKSRLCKKERKCVYGIFMPCSLACLLFHVVVVVGEDIFKDKRLLNIWETRARLESVPSTLWFLFLVYRLSFSSLIKTRANRSEIFHVRWRHNRFFVRPGLDSIEIASWKERFDGAEWKANLVK